MTSNVTSDGLSDVNTSMPFNVPVYREVVIVYFKEMPVSVGEFASSYGVSPVFVKGDIRMAAFESDPVMVGGVVSEKTALAIERISKDPRVESVKRDTYMFVDPRQEIDMTPRLIYPEDLEKKGVEVIPDRVCVGFWRLPPSLDEFGEKYGGKPIDLTETNLRLQWVSYETKDVKGFIDRASKDPYVQYIEVHGKGQWATIPNDEYWNSSSQNYTYTWGQRRVYAPEAWTYQTGSESIIVGLIDSGVQLDHPDLTGRFTNDGYDCLNNDSDPSDDYGHGTAMAGVIGSSWNNGIGYAGMSKSKILPIKNGDIYGPDPDATSRGIDYAVNHGAKIISMSFGFSSDYINVRTSIANAYSAGCILVAAAGNYASNNTLYPAGYDNVIGVSATDRSDQLASFSNFGPTVDLSAPGVDIGTTSMGSMYAAIDGTSPAAAMVSGVAALVWSQNPTTLRDRILTYLYNSADDRGASGRDDQFGYGIVNAYGAVMYGQMRAVGTGNLPGSGYAAQTSLYVPADSYVDTIMVGNENSNLDILLKWNSPPTLSSYDAASGSNYSLERALTRGSGTLYILVYAFSGGGNFKLCSISGAPTDGSFVADTLQQGYGYYSGGQGWGKGYAFNSGPDGCNFDLAVKWNQIASPYVYDAKSETPAAQEIVGPVYGTGTFYSTVYSQSGIGEFAMLRFVY
ncbi:S8 family peptidase [Methanocella conradii]|uniref:S8 family peptidase n=1 Tax=Methanocella conradii TaxID=1175444 RepID=UPI00130515D7|nr:S8 family serine peptidase [Methanocella conradii]